MADKIKQDGKTYTKNIFGEWVAEKDAFGNDKVDRSWLGEPKVERDMFGEQKISRDMFGQPIIPTGSTDEMVAETQIGTGLEQESPYLSNLQKGATRVSNNKTAFADSFFQARNSFNQNNNTKDATAVMIISSHINLLLADYGKRAVSFNSPKELGLELVGLLLSELNIEPSEYEITHINKTLAQLKDDGDAEAYSRQAQYAVVEKVKSGELGENPLILMLVLATDFVCRSSGLGGQGAYKAHLYKLFMYEGRLPQSLFEIWGALAVATEFDSDLWDDYQIKLFELKSSISSTPPSKPSSQNPTGNKTGGCYIATAVYGSYNAPEVLVLRRYRDERLSRSALGRAFIAAYYKLSPPIAKKLESANKMNYFVRKSLDRFINHLTSE